jgi:hypothetical protein
MAAKITDFERTPAGAAAQAKKIDLQNQLAAAERRRSDLYIQQSTRDVSRGSEISKFADRLYQGAGGGDEIGPQTSLEDQLCAAEDRCNALRQAIARAEREIERIRLDESSKLAAGGARDAYRKLERTTATQLFALLATVEDEREFRESIIDAGYVFHQIGSPTVLRALGDPRDRNSRAAMFVAELIEGGFLAQSDVPARYRELWLK